MKLLFGKLINFCTLMLFKPFQALFCLFVDIYNNKDVRDEFCVK